MILINLASFLLSYFQLPEAKTKSHVLGSVWHWWKWKLEEAEYHHQSRVKKSKLPKHKGCKRKGCRLLLLSLEKYKVITEKWNWYAWEVPYSSWICSIFLLDQRTCDTPGTKDVFRYYHYILCSHLAFSHFLSSVSSCIIYACNILTKHARMQNRAQVKRRQSTWGTNILKEKMEKTAA